MGKDGVSVPIKPNVNGGRDKNGRFVRGGPGGPGRPSRAQEVAMLDAIKASMPPERIQRILDDVEQFAEETKSWRAKMALAEFAVNYTIGKPVQRVQQETGGLDDVLERLSALDDE